MIYKSRTQHHVTEKSISMKPNISVQSESLLKSILVSLHTGAASVAQEYLTLEAHGMALLRHRCLCVSQLTQHWVGLAVLGCGYGQVCLPEMEAGALAGGDLQHHGILCGEHARHDSIGRGRCMQMFGYMVLNQSTRAAATIL